ncbi:hypothetical protein B296_00053245 [Ensete ventricosum]|uniref:Uncharacterized protein n=1 Tax=Ensete ventricosum TaxID=4639 RepID=A0A426X7F8_ENSVE|nr:hypothetical protein B296_00053245 [Ensete ventricosum]
MFENPIRSDYHWSIMPPQDHAPVKDADLEQMPINLKEGDHFNHSEGLAAVDFGGHVNLAEKEGAGMAKRRFGMGHKITRGAMAGEEEGVAVRRMLELSATGAAVGYNTGEEGELLVKEVATVAGRV